jgi:hypothetical protein
VTDATEEAIGRVLAAIPEHWATCGEDDTTCHAPEYCKQDRATVEREVRRAVLAGQIAVLETIDCRYANDPPTESWCHVMLAEAAWCTRCDKLVDLMAQLQAMEGRE